MTSIVRNNEDYFGKVVFTMVRQELADIFPFPFPNRKTRVSCVVVARPYHMDELVAKVSNFLEGS